MNNQSHTVLIVDDERPLAELYEEWLGDQYGTRIAHDGEEALKRISDTIDVVLLDRRMPGLTGGEVLQSIRENGYRVQVAMVTAVEPDYDIIDMGFDDYIVKPMTREELIALVENLVSRSSYDDAVSRYFELASKKAALEAAKPPMELQESDEYAALVSELENVKANADGSRDRLTAETDFSKML